MVNDTSAIQFVLWFWECFNAWFGWPNVFNFDI